MKKYIIYPQDPNSYPKLPDGSHLKATECVEGWFILSEHRDLADADGWRDGVESDKATPLPVPEIS